MKRFVNFLALFKDGLEPPSITFNKTATASSSLYFPSDPSLAVRFERNSDILAPKKQCSGQARNIWQSNVSDQSPWFQVDLGQTYSTTQLVVWNRNDCCWGRLTPFSITISGTNATSSPTLKDQAPCFTSNDPKPPSTVGIYANCSSVGRYVIIRLTGQNNYDRGYNFHLCAIQVYGSVYIPPPPSPPPPLLPAPPSPSPPAPPYPPNPPGYYGCNATLFYNLSNFLDPIQVTQQRDFSFLSSNSQLTILTVFLRSCMIIINISSITATVVAGQCNSSASPVDSSNGLSAIFSSQVTSFGYYAPSLLYFLLDGNNIRTIDSNTPYAVTTLYTIQRTNTFGNYLNFVPVYGCKDDVVASIYYVMLANIDPNNELITGSYVLSAVNLISKTISWVAGNYTAYNVFPVRQGLNTSASFSPSHPGGNRCVVVNGTINIIDGINANILRQVTPSTGLTLNFVGNETAYPLSSQNGFRLNASFSISYGLEYLPLYQKFVYGGFETTKFFTTSLDGFQTSPSRCNGYYYGSAGYSSSAPAPGNRIFISNSYSLIYIDYLDINITNSTNTSGYSSPPPYPPWPPAQLFPPLPPSPPPSPNPSLYCYFPNPIASPDCAILADFYNSTGGQNWNSKTGWSIAATLGAYISSFLGVAVSSPPNNGVKSINLNNNQLSGTIPSTIGNLTNLGTLILSNNQLSGTIPSTIGSLSSLLSLYLNNNLLSGTIPSTMGNLANLGAFILFNNQLNGTIPATIGNLTNLLTLLLDNNQLSGTIPSTIGSLSNLMSLDLSSNQLNGTIPATIGNLTNLGFLNLNANKLNGTIPSIIGNLSSLVTLSLSNNQLNGTIPDAIGSIPSLTTLSLCSNSLSGSIPASLSRLTVLNLENNNNLYGNATLIPTPRLDGATVSIFGTNITGNLTTQLVNFCINDQTSCCGCNKTLVPNCPVTKSCGCTQ